jgi:uncharacterized membrane protein
METSRLEAFSDGVFAIAITLLILEVRLPDEPGHSLAHGLLRAWPDYLAYVVSFVTIGIMWANHHANFRLVGRASHGLVVANLLLLLVVAFIPFPTKVLGDHLRAAAADQRAAAVFYSGSFALMAVAYTVLWHTAAWNGRLIAPGAEAAAAEVTRRYRFGVPSYLVATLVAIWSMPLSLAVDAALALLYILPRSEPGSETSSRRPRGSRSGPDVR